MDDSRPLRRPTHRALAALAAVSLVALGSLGSSRPGFAQPRPDRALVRPQRAAGRGGEVRLISRYRPSLQPLTEGPLMTSPALLDRGNYESLREYGKAIMTQFPPDKFYYVGVGRTAGPVIAFLKNVSPDIATNFPSSDMGRAPSMLPRFRDNYRAHIEALLPESVRRGDRKLLLIDHSSGPSLRGLEAVFNDYRIAGGALPPTELVSVGTRASGIPSITIDQGFWKDREAVAEFIGETGDKGHIMHSAGGSLSSLSRNPKYAEHRRALLHRMRRDADLDAFLRTSFPSLVHIAPSR
jgi:hypothetical protein